METILIQHSMNQVVRQGCFLLLLIAWVSATKAQNALYVKPFDGSQAVCQISEVRKLEFKSDEMILTKTDASVQTFLLNDIRLLSFKNYFTGIGDPFPARQGRLTLYPNPVKDWLHVGYAGNRATTMTLELIDIQGRILRRINKFEPGTPVDVNPMQPGIYVIRIIEPGTSSMSTFIKE